MNGYVVTIQVTTYFQYAQALSPFFPQDVKNVDTLVNNFSFLHSLASSYIWIQVEPCPPIALPNTSVLYPTILWGKKPKDLIALDVILLVFFFFFFFIFSFIKPLY